MVNLNLPLRILTNLTLLSSAVSSQDRSCNYLGDNCQANIQNATNTYPNYAGLNTSQLIQHFGYPAEVHKIITADKYILTAQRIPYSNASPLNPSTPKIPVFLLHGIFASSAQWFWQPANRALVFMLADAGYDVWLGNTRGTSYSSESADPNVSPSSPDFWDFSQHEMGLYDLPATFDYIKRASNQSSLYYIGHSLGATQMFVAIALNPAIQSSIRTFIGLAPVAYAGNATNPLFRTSAPVYSNFLLANTSALLTQGPVLPQQLQSHLVNFTDYCAYSAIDCSACSLGLLALFGIDPCQTNFTTLPGFLAHLPDSVSGKTFSHVLQDYQWATFDQYDYGLLGNLQTYGAIEPPTYKFWKNYTVPTVFFHSDNDNLADPLDIARTAAVLGPALKENNRVPYTSWTHLDFVFGIDADIYVYNRILQIFNGQIYG